jgi:hypothetical protein
MATTQSLATLKETATVGMGSTGLVPCTVGNVSL